MSFFEQLAFTFQALFRSLATLARPSSWLPWLPLLLVRGLLIACAWNFAHPALSWLMAPWIARLSGESVLHYPTLFVALPGWYARSDIAVQVLIGPLTIGAAVAVFGELFRGHPVAPGRALGQAAARYPALLLAQLPFHALIVLLTLGVMPWLGEHKHGLVARLLVRAGVLGGSALAETLLFFVAALLVLGRRSLVDTFAALPGALLRGFTAALVLGAVPVVTRLGLQALESHADVIATRGRPELVGALTCADAGLSVLAWYLLAGAATMVYLGAMHRAWEHE